MPRRDLRLSEDSLTFVGSFEQQQPQQQQQEHCHQMALPHHQRTKAQSSASTVPPLSGYSSRVLGTAGVVAITFLYGCGGSLGAGSIIAAAGPRLGLVAIAVYPLVMVVPYGYIIAELCSAFPHDGGFAVWVLHAFGPFWGFQVGYWAWIAGVFMCALVPDVTLRLALYCAGSDDLDSGVATFALKAAIAAILTLPTLCGTKVTARVCMALVVLALVPFGVFTIWSLAHTSARADFGQVRRETTVGSTVGSGAGSNSTSTEQGDVHASGRVAIDWSLLLNTLAWKFGGLNVASLFAGEVRDPARVFPRAIALTIALSLVTTLAPLVGALAAHCVPWLAYEHVNMFMMIAERIGGTVLYVLLAISSIATVVGRYIAGLYATSFQVSGMAEYELLPARLASKRNRFRSPQVAVLATAGTVLPLLLIQTEDFLSAINAFACAIELLILVAAVKLRLSMPYIPRPVKMPGGIATLVLATLGPATVLCYLLYDAAGAPHARYMIPIGVVPGLLCGVADCWCRRRWRDQGLFALAEPVDAVVTPTHEVN